MYFFALLFCLRLGIFDLLKHHHLWSRAQFPIQRLWVQELLGSVFPQAHGMWPEDANMNADYMPLLPFVIKRTTYSVSKMIGKGLVTKYLYVSRRDVGYHLSN